jgi:transglutaminase-like putative cysteine protease
MRLSFPFRAAVFILAGTIPVFCSQRHAAAQAQPPHPAIAVPHANGTAATQDASAQPKPDQTQRSYTIERYSTDAVFHNDGTSRSDLEVIVKVEDQAGVERFGHLAFGYNPRDQELNVISVQVRKAGKANFTSASAVRDVSPLEQDSASAYASYREKVVTVPGLHTGDTLAYHVELVTTVPAARGHFWFEYEFLKDANVLDEQVEISVPSGRDVTLKTRPGFEPTITEAGTARIYRWRNDHRTSRSENQGEKTGGGGPTQQAPAIQLTTFRSWTEVGRWYAALERKRAAPDATIRARADKLTGGLTTEREKIEALYDFVGTRLRSVNLSFGLGGYQPHAAAVVLANQYGNSNDKHTLLEALLAAAGIRAYPVLIPYARRIDTDVPSPAQFDYRMLVVPTGADPMDWIWLDTTTEVAPFRMLAAPLRGKLALVIPTAALRAGAAPGPARLIETPEDPPSGQIQQIRVTGRVSHLGNLTAHVRYSMTGDNALTLRMAFHRTPRTEWKQLGQLLSLNDGFRGEVTDVQVSDPAHTRKPFEVDYEITQAKFLDWSQKDPELILPLPSIGIPAVPDGAVGRAETLQLGSPLEVDASASIELPPGSRLRLPVPVNVARDYAAYRSSYSSRGNLVTADRHIVFLHRNIPPASLTDYLAFARALHMDEAQSVAVETTVEPPAPPKD